MKVTKTIFCWGVLLLGLFAAALKAEAQEPERNPLQLQAVLSNEKPAFHELLTAKMTLTNTGETPLKIETTSCTKMDNWMTDSEIIVNAEEKCETSEPVETMLAPGESFNDTIGLLMAAPLEKDEHAFRLGFRTGKDPMLYVWTEPLKIKTPRAGKN